MKRYHSSKMLKLYKLVWGPGIHFGLYQHGSETIEQAAINTKAAIVEAGEISTQDFVLEVGSGDGDTARWIAQKKGCQVTATDISSPQLTAGRLLTKKAGLCKRVTHTCANFTELPFGDEVFSKHLSQEAFVHCQDKPSYLREAFRVLRPGGRLILSEQTTYRKLCDSYTRQRLANRHGCADLWGADQMANAALNTGFVDIQILDWSTHMTTHFTNLVARIENNRNHILQTVPNDILTANEDIWRWGAKLGREGKIGWCLLTARKPG